MLKTTVYNTSSTLNRTELGRRVLHCETVFNALYSAYILHIFANGLGHSVIPCILILYGILNRYLLTGEDKLIKSDESISVLVHFLQRETQSSVFIQIVIYNVISKE